MAKQYVNTTINGDSHELLCDPTQTLLDVLRDQLDMTGTKEGCGTGDCGACTVNLATWDAARGVAKYRSANACSVPLCSLDGQAVTTIEGLDAILPQMFSKERNMSDFNL